MVFNTLTRAPLRAHTFQLFTLAIVAILLDPKHQVERLGYKGLYKMVKVKKLGAIASVENIRPHRFRHDFGTSITRKGLDPLYGNELVGY